MFTRRRQSRRYLMVKRSKIQKISWCYLTFFKMNFWFFVVALVPSRSIIFDLNVYTINSRTYYTSHSIFGFRDNCILYFWQFCIRSFRFNLSLVRYSFILSLEKFSQPLMCIWASLLIYFPHFPLVKRKKKELNNIYLPSRRNHWRTNSFDSKIKRAKMKKKRKIQNWKKRI